MKRYFITGLILLLPLALTFIIVAFIFNLLTNPFVGVVQAILGHYHLFTNEDVQIMISRILILIFLFFFITFLGLITRIVFVHYIIRAWDYILHKIPFVRAIYKGSQDVISTIFKNDNYSFKQVVMVPFPNAETRSIGLVTRENLKDIPKEIGNNNVVVFVPTTPNPTSGFLMLFDPKDLVYLDMSVEDAFKYIISLGVIVAPFKNRSDL